MARDPSGPGAPSKPGSSSIPAPPPPPKKPPKNLNAGAAFNQFVKKHPGLKPYADLIWKWSKQYGVDAVELAALIQFESGGKPGARSHANALGLAQIHMPFWAGKSTPWGEVITEANAKNPAFAVRFAAWYWSQQKEKHGTIEAAYRNGYNPGYKGERGPWSLLPSGYVPRTGALSPSDQASVSVETSAEKQALTDPWVTIDKNGKIKHVYSLEPPKNVVRMGGTIPVTASQWNQAVMSYDSVWYSLTGEANIPASRLANWLRKGWSPTVVSNVVAKSHPKFTNSPLWKAKAPGMIATARELFGNDWKGDPKLIRRAIAEGWDNATFVAKLKERPEYVKGPVFKSLEAEFRNSLVKIYGRAIPEDTITIREAVAEGWTVGQWEQWLRSQEQYKGSAEAQDKMLALAQALGFVSGEQATLVAGTPPANPAFQPDQKSAGGDMGLPKGTVGNENATGVPANDKRIPGRAQPVKGQNLVVGRQ